MRRVEPALLFALVLSASAGCGGEPVDTTTAPLSNVAFNGATKHRYRVTIDNFWISKTRAKYSDTLTAVINVAADLKVTWTSGNELRKSWSGTDAGFGGGWFSLGNFGTGGHNIDPALFARDTWFDASNDEILQIGVGLVNDGGHKSSYAAATQQFSRYPLDYHYYPAPATPPATTLYAAGPIWPVDLKPIKEWVMLGGLCDGIVATDGMMVYGSELETLTANGPYTRTVMAPGTDSAVGCGENSLYYMTWTLSREY
jgi:hypothetical protein